LKKQYDDLRTELYKSKCNLAEYKRGLASVEKQLVHYQTNESLLNETIVVLKKDMSYRDSEIVVLKLIGSQITDNSKKGLGYISYNAVVPPHTRRFSPSRIDLSYTGLPEFVDPSIKSYRVKPIKVVTPKSSLKMSTPIRENNGAPLIKDWELDEEDEVESPPEIKRKIVASSVDKVQVDIPKQNVKPARRPVKHAEMYRIQRPRGQYNSTRIDGFMYNIVKKKIKSLKTDLMQTKQIYGDAYTKLIKKLKRLEQTVKSSQASEMTKELL
nr:hypothetical protein [Tanacetum cinerariifolium]